MLIRITSETLRGFVMLRADRELLVQFFLKACQNGRLSEKDDECNEEEHQHSLRFRASQKLFDPYHARKLVIKEELWSLQSYRIECEIWNDELCDTFPFSDFFSEIPVLNISSHCFPELFITLFSSFLISTDCISKIMIIWNCSVKIRENESDEPSDDEWLRSSSKSIQNSFTPQKLNLFFREISIVFFEYFWDNHFFHNLLNEWIENKERFIWLIIESIPFPHFMDSVHKLNVIDSIGILSPSESVSFCVSRDCHLDFIDDVLTSCGVHKF